MLDSKAVYQQKKERIKHRARRLWREAFEALKKAQWELFLNYLEQLRHCVIQTVRQDQLYALERAQNHLESEESSASGYIGATHVDFYKELRQGQLFKENGGLLIEPKLSVDRDPFLRDLIELVGRDSFLFLLDMRNYPRQVFDEWQANSPSDQSNEVIDRAIKYDLFSRELLHFLAVDDLSDKAVEQLKNEQRTEFLRKKYRWISEEQIQKICQAMSREWVLFLDRNQVETLCNDIKSILPIHLEAHSGLSKWVDQHNPAELEFIYCLEGRLHSKKDTECSAEEMISLLFERESNALNFSEQNVLSPVSEGGIVFDQKIKLDESTIQIITERVHFYLESCLDAVLTESQILSVIRGDRSDPAAFVEEKQIQACLNFVRNEILKGNERCRLDHEKIQKITVFVINLMLTSKQARSIGFNLSQAQILNILQAEGPLELQMDVSQIELIKNRLTHKCSNFEPSNRLSELIIQKLLNSKVNISAEQRQKMISAYKGSLSDAEFKIFQDLKDREFKQQKYVEQTLNQYIKKTEMITLEDLKTSSVLFLSDALNRLTLRAQSQWLNWKKDILLKKVECLRNSMNLFAKDAEILSKRGVCAHLRRLSQDRVLSEHVDTFSRVLSYFFHRPTRTQRTLEKISQYVEQADETYRIEVCKSLMLGGDQGE